MPLTLVLGASENPNRTSHTAVYMLLKNGHDVVAVGNKAGKIGVTPIVTEIPSDIVIDTITLYINPEVQKEMEKTILQAKPRRIIFNPGTENNLMAVKANALGIETFEACTLVLLSTSQY